MAVQQQVIQLLNISGHKRLFLMKMVIVYHNGLQFLRIVGEQPPYHFFRRVPASQILPTDFMMIVLHLI